MSAIPLEADIERQTFDVRFMPTGDIPLTEKLSYPEHKSHSGSVYAIGPATHAQ